jgi:hypothetical protein
MFSNIHTNAPQARQLRRAITNAIRTASAESRMAAAEAKRERKNAKRARDHHHHRAEAAPISLSNLL